VAKGGNALRYEGRTTTDSAGNYRLEGVPTRKLCEDTIAALKIWEWEESDADITVFARKNPSAALDDCPHYIIQLAAEPTTGPDVVLTAGTGINGVLKQGGNSFGLEGMVVYLDELGGPSGTADAQGEFHIAFMPTPGRHTLIAYLPWDTRFSGVGRVAVDVPETRQVDDVVLQIDDLQGVKVQFLDSAGTPLEGVHVESASHPDSDELRRTTVGTVSDASGWASLYLCPDGDYIVSGYDDRGRGLMCSENVTITPRPGTVSSISMTMIPAAGIKGRMIGPNGAPMCAEFLGPVSYADGSSDRLRFVTDRNGVFDTRKADSLSLLRPGIATFTLTDCGGGLVSAGQKSLVLAPGESKDLGDVRLMAAPTAAVTARLLTSDGSPVAWAAVSLSFVYDDSTYANVFTTTDAQGRVDSRSPGGRGVLRSGTVVSWRLSKDALPRLWASRKETLTLAPGEVKDLGDLVMKSIAEMNEK
jgi:hypothetical protein